VSRTPEDIISEVLDTRLPKKGPGVRLLWGETGYGGSWDPFHEEISVGKTYIKKGWAPAVLGHELAHRREGLVTLGGEASERTFWKELAAWEAAIERGLPREEISELLIEDSLGGYLDDVQSEHGEDSREYREAKEGYLRFKRRFL